jgi:hypothetical protein
MATTDEIGDGEYIASAREFVENRLQESESPMSPSELAEEYGCSNGHVRNLMPDLVEDGVCDRVGHGKYIADTSTGNGVGEPTDDEITDPSDGVSDEPEPSEMAESDGSGDEVNTQDVISSDGVDGPSVDGQARSEDLDTTEIDPAKAAGATAAAGGIGLVSRLDERQMLIVFFVGLIAVWFLIGGSSSESEESSEEAETDESDDSGRVEGGLVR